MELKAKIVGLNNFLTDIYDEEMRLSLLLKKLNISSEQISLISKHYLAQVVASYIDSVKHTLTVDNDGAHLYQVMSHHYGFDEAGVDILQLPDYELVVHDALELCRLSEHKQAWEDELYHRAMELASEAGLTGHETLQAMNVKRSIDEKYAFLQELQQQRDLFNTEQQELIDQTIPLELRTRLKEIEAEFAVKLTQVNEQITLLENDIKAEVMLHGATVRSRHYTVVFNGGNTIWDNQKLKLYAKNHPEILSLRKQTKPYAIIKIKN